MDTKTLIFKGGTKNNSILNKVYNKHINSIITTLSEEDGYRWETYSVIIQEMVKHKEIDIIDEIKYRLTDGENPNEVFLSILNRDSDKFDGIIWFLKKRIEEYLEEDYFRRFYI